MCTLIAMLIMLIGGLYVLIAGKLKLTKNQQLEGWRTRVTGLILISPLPLSLTADFLADALVNAGMVEQASMNCCDPLEIVLVLVALLAAVIFAAITRPDAPASPSTPIAFPLSMLGATAFIVAGIFCAVSHCATLSIGSMVLHNYRLAQTKESFQQIQHPPSSVPVTTKAGFYHGELKDSCEYFVGEIRQYAGSRQEVEAFYREQSTGNRLFDDVELIFLIPGQPLSDLLPYQIKDISVWDLSTSDLEGALYLIFLMDIGNAGLDIRCD